MGTSWTSSDALGQAPFFYRFLASDLQEWSRRLGHGALLTALPDRLSGHRLAGRARDNARAREALALTR
jgi:hypothetical protein